MAGQDCEICRDQPAVRFMDTPWGECHCCLQCAEYYQDDEEMETDG